MQFERFFTVDLTSGQNNVPDIGTILCTGDDYSARIGVIITRNRVAEDISGTIKGFITLPNGLGRVIDGDKEGNRAWIDLSKYELGMRGRIEIAIRSYDTDETTVLLQTGATVRRVDPDEYYDPEDYVGDLSDLITEANRASGVAAAAAEAAQEALDQASNIVSYAEQTGHTEAEKAQARENIGAAAASDIETHSVVYNRAQDLTSVLAI